MAFMWSVSGDGSCWARPSRSENQGKVQAGTDWTAIPPSSHPRARPDWIRLLHLLVRAGLGAG